MAEPYCTTVLFGDRRDYLKLKVAAVINCVPIGELLDVLVDQELKQFTKPEASAALAKHHARGRLLEVL